MPPAFIRLLSAFVPNIKYSKPSTQYLLPYTIYLNAQRKKVSASYFRSILNPFAKRFILIVVSLFIGMLLHAQEDTLPGPQTSPDWYKQTLRSEAGITSHSSEDIEKTMKWKWECIGPNVQPEELNPGGRAIPAYAVNRGNGTGRINYLYVHPKDGNKVWACSPTGGIWYTRNGGRNWLLGGTDALPISGVSSVAVNNAKPRQWVISTGDGDDQFMFTDGLWRTTNGGKKYENINGSDPSTALPFRTDHFTTFIGEVVCKPDNFNFLIVASSNGLWVCENASETIKGRFFQKIFGKGIASQRWKRVAEGQFYDIEIIPHPSAGDNIIVAAGEKLVVSYDGGGTWETMSQPKYENPDKFKFLRMSVEYSPAFPYFLYVAVTCSERAVMSAIGDGSLQLFDLKTKEWSLIRPLNREVTNIIPTRARAFAISPVKPSHLLCANVQPINLSVDGGKTFSKIEKNQMHDDVHHIVFTGDGKTAWASHDGGVSVSYDEGMHWQSMDKGIGAANVFGVSTSQTKELQIAYGAYDTGGNLLRENKWWHVSWGDGFETITSPSDADIIFTTMQNGLIQASTNGKSFDEGRSANSRSEWHTWIRMHPVDYNTIYCGGARLMRSTDLGRKWENIFDCKAQDSTLLTVYKYFLSASHPNVMYIYVLDEATKVNPQVWKTKNLLESDPSKLIWEKLPYIPITGWLSTLEVDDTDADKFWLLYNRPEADGKMWYFDGKRFNDHSFNLSGAKCETMIKQNGTSQRLYIGGNYGVFTKTRDETEWTLLKGLPGTYIKSLDINYVTKKLIVGTFGRGIWQSDLVQP